MVELQSSSVPMAPASAETEATKRPALTTRRSSKAGGIAMSLETRLPRELLARIGINGKEVVSIIKERDWDIEEPHGLQQQKLYYLPGAKEKREQAKQNEDFFVGEGELYAFILKQGGLRYLLPEEDLSTESDESDVEMTQPSRPTQGDAVSAANSPVEDSSDEMSDSCSSDSTAETTPGAEQRKWKRRKKLSTARNKAAEEMEKPMIPPTKRRRKAKKTVPATEQDDQDRIRVTPKVKLEQATCGEIGQQTEFSEYESSLTARGWRAQLLQDIDVHMLRSVAAVDRRQRAREASNEGQKRSGRPTEGVGPHAQDAAEILQELDGLTHSIQASQDDLSSMIESIIVQGERLSIPDRIDPVGRIGISGFVSTGPGSLVLMRDIERYLLLFVAAVRRYQRSRNAICTNERAKMSPLPTKRAMKRADLRALQLSIEESKRELQELATFVAAEAARARQEAAQDSLETSPSSSKGISQESSQSTSTTVRDDDTGT
ncbi:hypothetical protein V7S43_008511 [Phytophthora oleae]|uniref:Uncharacterized protein n=1 Tax=Phytophthora oleae TaxID=2107226 RepID=A0ABD3FK93_9STRA